jgi:hypothetical protein
MQRYWARGHRSAPRLRLGSLAPPAQPTLPQLPQIAIPVAGEAVQRCAACSAHLTWHTAAWPGSAAGAASPPAACACQAGGRRCCRGAAEGLPGTLQAGLLQLPPVSWSGKSVQHWATKTRRALCCHLRVVQHHGPGATPSPCVEENAALLRRCSCSAHTLAVSTENACKCRHLFRIKHVDKEDGEIALQPRHIIGASMQDLRRLLVLH